MTAFKAGNKTSGPRTALGRRGKYQFLRFFFYGISIDQPPRAGIFCGSCPGSPAASIPASPGPGAGGAARVEIHGNPWKSILSHPGFLVLPKPVPMGARRLLPLRTCSLQLRPWTKGLRSIESSTAPSLITPSSFFPDFFFRFFFFFPLSPP